MDEQRRSQIVTLTWVGLPIAVVVAANVIPAEIKMRRNLYADRAACERDYSPAQCQAPDNSSSSRYYGHTYYYGPYYNADRTTAAARSDPGAGRIGGLRTTTEISSRGGFGAFGRVVRAVG